MDRLLSFVTINKANRLFYGNAFRLKYTCNSKKSQVLSGLLTGESDNSCHVWDLASRQEVGFFDDLLIRDKVIDKKQGHEYEITDCGSDRPGVFNG